MKNVSIDLIKDIFISILIVVCIVLIIAIISYDKISISKVIPQSEEYQLSEEMKKDLDETYTEESKEIVTTYYLDAADLKKYEATKEYNKGKKNPFAVESETTNEATNNIDSNESESSSNSTNFYEDDGTK